MISGRVNLRSRSGVRPHADSQQPLFSGGWLLREHEDSLVEQVRNLLDAVEREQTALPQWLSGTFASWIFATRRWVDDPASAADDERLREILDRLRAYRTLVAYFAKRDQ